MNNRFTTIIKTNQIYSGFFGVDGVFPLSTTESVPEEIMTILEEVFIKYVQNLYQESIKIQKLDIHDFFYMINYSKPAQQLLVVKHCTQYNSLNSGMLNYFVLDNFFFKKHPFIKNKIFTIR